MLLRVFVMSDDGVHHSFDDVLLGHNWFHVLDKLESFIDLFILEVVDDKVQTCLRHQIKQGRKYLECILTVPKDDKVVSQQVIVFKHVS